jgi:hypothetical protein
MHLINKRASVLARKAEVVYAALLANAAFKAMGQGVRITEDWLDHQLPAIDDDMRAESGLHEDADDDWQDIKPF